MDEYANIRLIKSMLLLFSTITVSIILIHGAKHLVQYGYIPTYVTTTMVIILSIIMYIITIRIILPIVALLVSKVNEAKAKIINKIIKPNKIRNIMQRYNDMYNKSASRVSLIGWMIRIVLKPFYLGIIVALSLLVNKIK